jgi:hypothetical protein
MLVKHDRKIDHIKKIDKSLIVRDQKNKNHGDQRAKKILNKMKTDSFVNKMNENIGNQN